MATHAEHRAEAPRPPQPGRAKLRAQEAQRVHRTQRAELERRSVVRGLLLLAGIALVFSIARAGLDRVFVPGWWAQW